MINSFQRFLNYYLIILALHLRKSLLKNQNLDFLDQDKHYTLLFPEIIVNGWKGK